MEGGVRTPPNAVRPATARSPGLNFNGGRRAHAAEFLHRKPVGFPTRTSMEGGVRTPPNMPLIWPLRRPVALLQWRAACARRRIRRPRRPPADRRTPLQWRAACARRRILLGCRQGRACCRTSMEGGVRTPPNSPTQAAMSARSSLQWRAACARRRIRRGLVGTRGGPHFNGGRRAHAAEYRLSVVGTPELVTSMEGGVRTPPNGGRGRCRPGRGCYFNGGRRAHAAE